MLQLLDAMYNLAASECHEFSEIALKACRGIAGTD
jgi:hypothetical protein